MLNATLEQVEILSASKPSDVPEWVHLLPLGVTKARDGRIFSVEDAQTVVDSFVANNGDRPVDYEHQTEKAKRNPNASGPTPAAGWIKELRHNASGIWGRIAWTLRAHELIKNKEYRYISPVVGFSERTSKTHNVSSILGAGLVHSPALELAALAEEQTTPALKDFIAELALLLGLGEEATTQDIVTAVSGLSEASLSFDPTLHVPTEMFSEMVAERDDAKAQLLETIVANRAAKAEDDGHITGGQRAWARALCERDIEAFDAFIAGSTAPYAHLTKGFRKQV